LTQEDWVEAYCLAGDILQGLRIARREGLLSPRLPEAISGRDPEARRFLHLLYPLPARFDIPEKARQRGLDPFLVAGLIHQESVFMHDAVSPAGAVGLMQIMPATGRRVAEKIGLEGFAPASLREPEVNLRIGTAYLEGLATRYEEDWPKVFAAYNAGPGAVARWTTLMPMAETDEFVEGILYRETRIYVKKVLFNWSLYHRIYGGRGPDVAIE
jgi:soluble lytic murein transglycosylase